MRHPRVTGLMVENAVPQQPKRVSRYGKEIPKAMKTASGTSCSGTQL